MIYQLNIQCVLKYLVTLLLCFYSLFVYADSDFNPHQMNKITNSSASQCLNCHKIKPPMEAGFSGKHVIPNMLSFNKNETEMCSDCHEDSSHIVGITPDYKVPADLPLDKNNQITCITCHYVHGQLASDKPMASTSFMDHIFNRDRLNKSYILRRNNAEGDMCLACHSEK